MLRTILPSELPDGRRDPVDAETLATAAAIVADVRDRGLPALRALAERFAERTPDQPLLLGPDVLEAAWRALPADQQALLHRTADRIEAFARAQRGALLDLGAKSTPPFSPPALDQTAVPAQRG